MCFWVFFSKFLYLYKENHLCLLMRQTLKAQMIIIMNLLIFLYAEIYNQCFFISGLLHSEKLALVQEYRKLYKKTGVMLIMELAPRTY